MNGLGSRRLAGMTNDAGGQPVTVLLEAAGRGDREAAARLLPIVYEELRQLARARMAGTPGGGAGNTLQPTALVHEAYMRLVGARGSGSPSLTSGGEAVAGTGGADSHDPGWKGRGHFFGAAARAMREILVDQARRKAAAKHGGGLERGSVGDAVAEPAFELHEPAEDVLALNAAVQRLEELDPRKAEIVSLRHFAGLTQGETAAALGVSERTVEREWRFIKAWLARELSGNRPGGTNTEAGGGQQE
jgi:RNA polymerase sigma factor (sigma-70 family)